MTETLKRWPLAGLLVQDFPVWLAYYEKNTPFRRYGQLEFHREAVNRRFELASALAAVADDQFLNSLYKTLQAWGIGSRASKLKSFPEFCAVLQSQPKVIGDLEAFSLDDPSLDVTDVTDKLWRLIDLLPIVENAARLVPVTKALHHVLPDLVVPMDREYTQMFFGWQSPKFQYGQRECFTEAFMVFAEIARVVQPIQYVAAGWNSSRTKVIDNAVVGFIQSVKAKVKSEAG